MSNSARSSLRVMRSGAGHWARSTPSTFFVLEGGNRRFRVEGGAVIAARRLVTAVCSRHAAVFMSREPNISTLQFPEPPLSQQAPFHMAPRDSSSFGLGSLLSDVTCFTFSN